MKTVRTNTLGTLMGLFAALLAATPPSRADAAAVPLGQMIAHSDRVFIGVVEAVEPIETIAGAQAATILVEKDLVGAGVTNVTLEGNSLDPMQPTFYAGTRILAFVNGGDTPRAPVVVAGEQGIVAVAEQTLEPARELVRIVAQRGDQLRLVDVQPFLDGREPQPPALLLGELFEELSLRVTATEEPRLLDILCSPEAYPRPLAEFAVSRVADLQLGGARACLENVVRLSDDRNLKILAVEALGDLGDAASVATLLALIPRVEPDPFTPSLELPDDPGQGPDDDPEDVSDPEPDPYDEDDAPDLASSPEVPLHPSDEPVINVEDDDGESDPGGVAEDDDGDDSPDDVSSLRTRARVRVPAVTTDRGPDDGAVADREPVGPGGPGAVDFDVAHERYGTTQAGRDGLDPSNVDDGMLEAAVLALGKIGDPRAVRRIAALTRAGDDLALHSTVVVALSLIGGPDVVPSLNLIRVAHPNPYVRTLAEQVLSRVQN